MRQVPVAVRYGFMPSTVIRRFLYEPESRELTIEFVTGRRYMFSQVPPEDVDAFRRAFSKGAHFNRHIRNRYSCRELAPADQDRN